MEDKKTKNYSRRYISEYTFGKWLFQLWAVYFMLGPILTLFYDVKVEGKENIPKNKKIIPTANHISYMDPFLVSLVINKPIAFMAKKELFNPFEAKSLKMKIVRKFDFLKIFDLQVWMDRLGAFAVNREKLEVSTIKTAKDILKTKHWTVGIFPQGGIYRNRKIEKINKGFVLLAKMIKAEVLPISITGCEEYNWNLFKKATLSIKIGKPIPSDLSDEEIVEIWGKTVAEMNGYEYSPLTTAEEDKMLLSNHTNA